MTPSVEVKIISVYCKVHDECMMLYTFICGEMIHALFDIDEDYHKARKVFMDCLEAFLRRVEREQKGALA